MDESRILEEVGKEEACLALKYFVERSDVSASGFITLLVHVDNDLDRPVCLLMRRWDNFGKAVSRNFDSTQRKGCINASYIRKKDSLLRLLLRMKGEKLEVGSGRQQSTF